MLTSRKKRKDPILCSFCGKNQHEVGKVVAGPTVFICNECIELCDDIIWDEMHADKNAKGLRIRVKSRETELSETLEKTLIDAVSSQFPDYEITYAFAKLKEDNRYIHLIAHKRDGRKFDEAERERLEDDLQKLTLKLEVTSKKFINESKRREAVELELTEIKSELLFVLRKELGKEHSATSLRAVMFLDVSGFSKLGDAQKQEVLDLLRGMVSPLLHERGATAINTWGDGIVCTFEDHEQALKSAAKFIRHLAVEQFDCRIGMAWGEVRTSLNKAINRTDIDGSVVNFAARLEPLAPLGQVLLSSDFGGLEIKDPSIRLVPHQVQLKKGFDNYKTGDELDTFLLEIKKN